MKDQPDKSATSVKPPARRARLLPRHYGVAASFVLLVLAPLSAILVYLYAIAEDQYVSRVGFSIRSEDLASSSDILGGLVSLSSGSSKDADILYEYIQSQQVVEKIDDNIDLRGLFSVPKYDPIFAFDPEGTIEDLVAYWARMVTIDYDASTGLIEIRTRAFRPEHAKSITEELLESSSTLINELSKVARSDATRYSKEQLDVTKEQLKDARKAVALFRNETQIVDPTIDVQGQMGLLSNLENQLAEAFIELDLLVDVTRVSDPRIEQAERKIEVITNRISEERKKFGLNESNSTDAYSSIIGRFEALSIDLEFAQQSYLAARTSYDSSIAEANRQSRYLATYLDPTLAERAEYPRRLTLSFMAAFLLLTSWSVVVLLGYSLKDRR